MPVAEQLDSVTNERLRKQGEFLLRIYRLSLRSRIYPSEITPDDVIGFQVVHIPVRNYRHPALNGLN